VNGYTPLLDFLTKHNYLYYIKFKVTVFFFLQTSPKKSCISPTISQDHGLKNGVCIHTQIFCFLIYFILY